MKTQIFRLLCVFAVSACVWGAPKYMASDPYANLARFHFGNKSGKWDTARNWQGGKVPMAGFVRVYIPQGVNVTLSGAVDNTESVHIGTGGARKTVLNVEKGAKAKFSLLIVGAQGDKDSTGELYIRGGEVSVGTDKGHTGVLCIGSGGTFSGTGYAEISGGTFKGGIKIGSDVPQTQAGKLVVCGSAPTLATHPDGNNFIMIGASGVLEFVADAKGFAKADYTEGRIYLSAGATVRVDGAEYTGGAKTFTLVRAERIQDEGARLEAVNFSPNLDAKILVERRGDAESLVVRIVRK